MNKIFSNSDPFASGENPERRHFVMLFSTNIRDESAIEKVAPALNNIPNIALWSIDVQDCDKVLRVVSHSDVTREIITCLLTEGFKCEAMDY